MEVTLVADGKDTVLTLRHSGIPPVYAGEHGAGWAHHLGVLVAMQHGPAAAT